jgi:hypothetical protein
LELASSTQIMVWKVVQLKGARSTQLDVILSVLRDCAGQPIDIRAENRQPSNRP